MKSYSRLPVSLYFLLTGLLISCGPSRDVTYWDVLDQNSVFVFETIHSPKVLDKSILPFLKVSSTSFVIALQSVSKNDYELVYSFVLPEHEYALLLSKGELKSSSQKITSRLYSGFQIKEIRSKQNEVHLAFAYLKGVFILSKSSLLIENAIRTYESRVGVNFRANNKALFQFASIKSDAGNLFVNFSQLYQSTLMNSSLKESIPLLNGFAKSCMLDVKVDKDFVSMNGFTLDSLREPPGLTRFQTQKAVKFEVARFIPNYSKTLIHYGVSDLVNFSKLIKASDASKLNFGDEIAVSFLDQDSKRALIFVQTKDSDVSSFESGDYYESYSGYDIRGFRKKLISDYFRCLVPTDSLEFFTVKENFLFISKEVDDLKRLIDAIESDDTWGKSLEFQEFYGRGLQESNVSLFFREPLFSDNVVIEKWRPLMDSLQLSKINWASLQFTALDNHFYTSVNLALAPQEREDNVNKSKLIAKSYNLPNSIVSGYVVKNHINSGTELMLQDSTFRLYLFSPESGILWYYQTDGIAQGIHQVDYFKNGKLQYFINTPKSIYILDRLGRDVLHFPKKLDFVAGFSDLVDYDKSRNYRFLLTSGASEIFILDKSGNPLEGWSPKHIAGTIKETPKHYRIGGKDFFLICTEDGTFHLLSRKGDYQKGFPLKLNTFSGDYYLEKGNSLSSSYIHLVTSEGITTQQSLDARSKTQANLVRGVNSKFLLRKDNEESVFYFFRIDSDKLAVFDKTNQLVFEKQNPGSTSLNPFAFEVSKKKTIFCFYDQEQNLSYLFDRTGNSVINRPLESTILPLFGKDSKTNRPLVFSFFDNVISATPLN